MFSLQLCPVGELSSSVMAYSPGSLLATQTHGAVHRGREVEFLAGGAGLLFLVQNKGLPVSEIPTTGLG